MLDTCCTSQHQMAEVLAGLHASMVPHGAGCRCVCGSLQCHLHCYSLVVQVQAMGHQKFWPLHAGRDGLLEVHVPVSLSGCTIIYQLVSHCEMLHYKLSHSVISQCLQAV